ncbi:unnamed protein product [Candida verbasci]|uniref:B30.2/SPRY domain-containing protein n=1 Tax=Candida verbasci TaxID=1227364 RepID=A0A9W4TZ52_9ASCO|nr:unnamed protein product [Candida verbasci]
MDKSISEEPSYQPQVEESGSYSYSTSSKEKKEEQEEINESKLKQKQHNVILYPRLKPVPFKESDLNSTILPTLNKEIEINGIEFFQSEDTPLNRRGFKYKLCRPNPTFSSNLYSTTEIEPFKITTSLFDRSGGILFNEDLSTITTKQGWRSTRTNVGIDEGSYYFEFKILQANEKSHVRIGIGRKEASLEAPVGFDGYGYGIRDVDGYLMSISRRKKQVIENGFETGDVIGILIELPSLEEHRKMVKDFEDVKKEELKHQKLKKRKMAKKKVDLEENIKFDEFGNIVRDQIPIRYKNALYYEQYEYSSTKTMDHLLNPISVVGEKAIIEMDDKTKNIPIIENSKITFYKNGVKQDEFTDLYSFLPTNVEDNEDINLGPNIKQQQNPNYKNTNDGSLGYYPMLSSFQYGCVKLNPGPYFEYPVTHPVKPLSDRYDESIIEEWYWDLLDEVEAEYMDSFD